MIKYVGSGQYFMQNKWAGRPQKPGKCNEKDVLKNLLVSIQINNRDCRVPYFQVDCSILIVFFVPMFVFLFQNNILKF